MKLTAEQTKRAQATRRKTLFPLKPSEVSRQRALLAHHLHHNCKLDFYAIRQVLQVSPDRARTLVGKAERIKRELDRQYACTCPAAVDITYIGHLPNCPTHQRIDQ
jgi:hypothetical protein